MPSAPHRALLVIDVQNEYVTGNLRIEYPPVQTSLAHIGQAMDAAQLVSIPVIVVQNCAPEHAPLFARGSHAWRLHPVVTARPHNLLIEKSLPGAFTGTGLGAWLQHQKVDTLTVAGYMTHNCAAATIMDALHRDLAVEFLADAAGSVSYRNEAGFASAAEIHRIFSVVLHSRFATVIATQVWIEAVKNGHSLPRSSVFASHAAAVA